MVGRCCWSPGHTWCTTSAAPRRPKARVAQAYRASFYRYCDLYGLWGLKAFSRLGLSLRRLVRGRSLMRVLLDCRMADVVGRRPLHDRACPRPGRSRRCRTRAGLRRGGASACDARPGRGGRGCRRRIPSACAERWSSGASLARRSPTSCTARTSRRRCRCARRSSSRCTTSRRFSCPASCRRPRSGSSTAAGTRAPRAWPTASSCRRAPRRRTWTRLFPAARGKLAVTAEAADDFSSGPIGPLTGMLAHLASPPYLLSMGNTKPHKDLPTLLQAFARSGAVSGPIFACCWSARSHPGTSTRRWRARRRRCAARVAFTGRVERRRAAGAVCRRLGVRLSVALRRVRPAAAGGHGARRPGGVRGRRVAARGGRRRGAALPGRGLPGRLRRRWPACSTIRRCVSGSRGPAASAPRSSPGSAPRPPPSPCTARRCSSFASRRTREDSAG